MDADPAETPLRRRTKLQLFRMTRQPLALESLNDAFEPGEELVLTPNGWLNLCHRHFLRCFLKCSEERFHPCSNP